MCGRYLIEDEAYADIWELLNDPIMAQNIARGEIFPAATAAVYTNDGIAAVKWGFPHWQNTGVIINARSETALEKNMFRKALRERRCVVPSNGFYEWRRVSGRKYKDKYLFRQPKDRMLYMAGMVSTFKDTLGVEYSAFVILTTAANESVAPIHDRMPVILEPDERNWWLEDDVFMELALHRPSPELVSEIVRI